MGARKKARKRKAKVKHQPCAHRRFMKKYGMPMAIDWCYAIGCEEVGDMPCEYCVDHKMKSIPHERFT